MPRPPRDLDDLLERARRLEGRAIREVAHALGRSVPRDPVHAKGIAGEVVELALGATAGSTDQPDFAHLGIELKTVPLDEGGHVRESTWVCALDLAEVEHEEWPRSRVWRKLSRVLWVPVEWRPGLEPGERRIGTALLWSPSAEEEALLRADWLMLLGRIAVEGIEAISAHQGEALQLRPKAASSRVQVESIGPEGAVGSTVPRGFYLRARFTEAVLWQLARAGRRG